MYTPHDIFFLGTTDASQEATEEIGHPKEEQQAYEA